MRAAVPDSVRRGGSGAKDAVRHVRGHPGAGADTLPPQARGVARPGRLPDTPSQMRIRAIITADCHSHVRAYPCMLKRPQTAKHPALVRTLIACAAMTDLALPA